MDWGLYPFLFFRDCLNVRERASFSLFSLRSLWVFLQIASLLVWLPALLLCIPWVTRRAPRPLSVCLVYSYSRIVQAVRGTHHPGGRGSCLWLPRIERVRGTLSRPLARPAVCLNRPIWVADEEHPVVEYGFDLDWGASIIALLNPYSSINEKTRER
jgi:hypothetical protein